MKRNACSVLLGVSLRDHFSLWDKPLVGIRKDFKVVWFNAVASVPNNQNEAY